MAANSEKGRHGRRCCAGGALGLGRGRGRGFLLEPSILAALAGERAHGYDLRKTIEDMTGGVVCADPGGLYRGLRRLEEEGLVASHWAEGEYGPQRREYDLTAEGRSLLVEWLECLREWDKAYHSVLEAIEKSLSEMSPEAARRDGAKKGE
ncbi:MAG: PadR family transcriptional regulator [Actinobacteria bacterium]|nr:MAG: PadR family transcriptional regulator [Actinomycetota bacterium]